MKFNQTIIAASIASVLGFAVSGGQAATSSGALASPANPLSKTSAIEQSSSFENKESAVYSIQVAGGGALGQGKMLATTSVVDTSSVEKLQDSVFEQLQTFDGQAVLANRLKLVDSVIEVQTTPKAIEQLKAQVEGISVVKLERVAATNLEIANKALANQSSAKSADGAVTVAILSSGVDYTHSAIGGDGTRDSYELAMENRINGWDGFPTDTVIDGFDFVSELGGYYDYNPIDQEFPLTDTVTGVEYPTGRGTMVASTVLSYAPDAKILAYKIFGYTNGRVFGNHRDTIYAALERAMDPNQDGDISDRADILVLDAGQVFGFYKENDLSPATNEVNMLRNLSALGTMVVSPAGDFAFNSHYNISLRGTNPDGITVGSVLKDGEQMTPSDFSPYGPVRGATILKPDLVASGENVSVAMPGTGDGRVEETRSLMSAAMVAGMVAKVKAARPELNIVEVKSLLMNTANSDIAYALEDLTSQAPVTRVGAGFPDADKAIASPALVWNNDGYQPNMHFGKVEVASSRNLVKTLTIKNVSDKKQTYFIDSQFNSANASNAAISWSLPASVTVAANSSVSFSAVMTIDASKLAAWPIGESAEYTLDNWAKTEVDGTISFKSLDQNAPELLLPWLVIPRASGDMDRHFTTMLDSSSTSFSAEWAALSDQGALETFMEFSNSTNHPQTYVALPIIRTEATPKPGLQGHLLKTMGSGIFDEAQCSSGKKLVVGAEMFQSFETTMANHFDKMGDRLFQLNLYPQATVENYGPSAFGIEMARPADSERLAHMWVALDAQGVPQTFYLDYSIAYDHSNPTARIRTSDLPTIAAPGGKTVVASVCLDELFHHDIDSVEDFDEKLGYQFATDRDAVSRVDEDIIQFNPVQYGGVEQYPFANPWMPWMPPTIMDAQGGNLVGMAKVTDADRDDEGKVIVDNLSYSPIITLLPGETAEYRVASDYVCTDGMAGIGDRSIDCDMQKGVMIFNSETRFFKTQNGRDGEGSILALPVENQGFVVTENAENGTLIGTIDNESEWFFGSGGISSYDGRRMDSTYLANAIPGTPFILTVEGEILVNNSDAIDFESGNSFELKVFTRDGNTTSKIVPVTVNVLNANDIAPEKIADIPTINGEENVMLSYDIAEYFTDTEGDRLTFSADSLPAGLSLSEAGVISGEPSESGSISGTVIVSDGVHSEAFSLSFDIAAAPVVVEEETSSGSGSFGFILLSLLAIRLFNRRH